MNATELAGIARNSDHFRGRVGYFLSKAAIAIMNESAVTPNHTERVVYSKKVLEGTINLPAAVLAVLTDTTIAAAANESAIVDANIENQVNAIFNALAGVST